jgi:hypothetical protein
VPLPNSQRHKRTKMPGPEGSSRRAGGVVLIGAGAVGRIVGTAGASVAAFFVAPAVSGSSSSCSTIW